MMEIADLPVLLRVPQIRLEPLQLLRIHLGAVEHEETDVVARVRVVALPVHVVELVRHVRRLIVVAEARPEFHAGSEERRVGLFELLDEVVRCLPPVHVVTEHDDEIEGERP